MDYDLLSGDLIAQVFPTGQRNYNYGVETGNLELVTFPGGTLTYTYDGNLLKSETWAGSVAGSVSRTYDTSLRAASQSVNGANTVNFTYDVDDLLTSAGSLTLTRSPQSGLLTSTTLGTVTDSYGHNSFGELTSYEATVGGIPVLSVTYTRDDLGRITEKTESIEGVTTTHTYGYDQAGRLTDVTKNASAIAHYEYDGNGNRIGGFNQVCGAISNVTVDNQDRLVTVACGPETHTYAYTANGELSSKTDAVGTTTYTYDVLGNLTRVVLPDTAQIDYGIDGHDRRIEKRVNGSLVHELLYDGQLTPMAKLDGSGALVGRFVYASKTTVPDYVTSSGAMYRIISDHLGSPRLVINTTTGAVVQRTDYDEFGNVVFEDVDASFQPLPFGYGGGLTDGDTGLLRFGARDYDPTIGRWVAKDPIGFDGDGVNLFAYAMADSINRNDPDGRLSYTNAGVLAGLSVSAAIHAVTRGTGLVRFPHDNDKRHRFTSCVLARRHLGIPAPLVSGPLFELATAIYRRQLDWNDIARDLTANLEGTIGAYDLSKTCEQVAR